MRTALKPITHQKQVKRESTLFNGDIADEKNKFFNIFAYVRKNFFRYGFRSSDAWVITSKEKQTLISKIEQQGTPLREWDVVINRGIITGCDEAFIIDKYSKWELIDLDPNCEKIINPVIRGRDVKRYYFDNPELFIINSHNGVKKENIPPVDITNDYPVIKKYLDDRRDFILKTKNIDLYNREDQGETPYNLRNCAYLLDFDKEKLIYSNMSVKPEFVYDDSGILTNAKCYILTGKHLKYLCAIGNSKIFHFAFWDRFVMLGKNGREMQKRVMLGIPIPLPTADTERQLTELVDQIIEAKQQQKNTKHLEAAIDNIVYEMYGLSLDEIDYIENNSK